MGEHLPCKQGVSGSNPLVSMEACGSVEKNDRSLTWLRRNDRLWGVGEDGPQESQNTQRRSQGTKSIRWMPWRVAAMKDVVNCEKLRGAVHRLRAGDVRMGEPASRHGLAFLAEFIGQESAPGELNHLSTRRKRNQARCPE